MTNDTTATRPWMPSGAQVRERAILTAMDGLSAMDLQRRVEALAVENRDIHERQCVNLNPATNVTNPMAEAMLATGLGSRPSLGYPGEKYEMGLEAIEEIEVIAAHLVREVFGAAFAEIRVPSGALANMYAFMATCRPGDPIIVPPVVVGGHVTHHQPGCAGLYGLTIHAGPADADNYTIDIDGLAEMARTVRPRLITIGSSLNLVPHPVAKVREIADSVGAHVLFDAAHACGMFASGEWASPLDEGAHLMTMSTYKSLGGPAGGLVVTNDEELAQRIDAIAYPGLTANFDAAKSAALAVTMLDWREHGAEYGSAMVSTARALAEALSAEGLPVFTTKQGFTRSHQFALDAGRWGGGHAAALRLRQANILSCAIGLPASNDPSAAGGEGAGLRLGTPEAVRWGMAAEHMGELASLIARGLNNDPATVASDTVDFRSRFPTLHYVRATS